MGSAPMEFLSTTEGGLGGEALYCAVILWLSAVAWIIFTCVGDDDEARGGHGSKTRGPRGGSLFVGATGLCDGTGPRCSGGFGPCGSCVD